MTKAQVRLSEMTLRKIASGETVTIRIAEVAELSVSLAPPPGSPPQPQTAGERFVDQIFGKDGGDFGDLFSSLFRKHPPK